MLKWKIGDVTITCVVETSAAFPCTGLLPDSTQEAVDAIAWLRPHFMDDKGRLLLSIHALVVDTPSATIMVDTCIGNDKPRTQLGNMMSTDFLDQLAAAGYPPESIDTVMCTHMHVDHVGWNTRLADGKWIPTFPKARYLFGRTEHDYWKDQKEGDDEAIFSDSIQPVFDAGLAELVSTDHRICDEVSLMSTPGHTPGHVSVRISSQGEQALITGDFLHHPCQIPHPEWCAYVDYDMKVSTATRKSVIEQFADQPVLIIGTHFANPTAGRIVRDGDTLRFDVNGVPQG